MKNFFLAGLALIVLSCGSTQKATNQIQSGNYTQAFNTSVAELNKDKTKKANQKLIPILKEAYTKSAEIDLAQINQLKSQNTPSALKNIYGKYLNLDIRQDEVRVLQPLYYEGAEVNFKFDDYTNKISNAKKQYSESLYSNAVTKLKGNHLAAREAYKHLEDLIYVNPDYKTNLNALLQQAKNKGSSFVLVTLKNNVRGVSNDSIRDFTRINSGDFSNKWVIFHAKKQSKTNYSHQVDITFDKLTFVPEKTEQQTVPQEARIQDGWQYKLDVNGNVMKDDKGNDIKTAKYKVIKAEVALYQQNKASKIDGTVAIKNLLTRANSAPKAEFGEAKFQHTYGKFRGDQRAIEQKYHAALQAKAIPYPKDHEFIKYTILNFKQKITALLSQQQF